MKKLLSMLVLASALIACAKDSKDKEVDSPCRKMPMAVNSFAEDGSFVADGSYSFDTELNAWKGEAKNNLDNGSRWTQYYQTEEDFIAEKNPGFRFRFMYQTNTPIRSSSYLSQEMMVSPYNPTSTYSTKLTTHYLYTQNIPDLVYDEEATITSVDEEGLYPTAGTAKIFKDGVEIGTSSFTLTMDYKGRTARLDETYCSPECSPGTTEVTFDANGNFLSGQSNSSGKPTGNILKYRFPELSFYASAPFQTQGSLEVCPIPDCPPGTYCPT